MAARGLTRFAKPAHPVEQLAHHAFHGEIWPKALLYQREAGAKVLQHPAKRQAVAYFAQAMAALQNLPERRDTHTQAIV